MSGTETMSEVYLDENPDWEPPFDGWEPWEPDEYEPEPHGGCDYCGTFEDLRDRPDPFGHRTCCERCFNVLIGGERDDPPWRCGTKLVALADRIREETQ